jgi:hypothetical protein
MLIPAGACVLGPWGRPWLRVSLRGGGSGLEGVAQLSRPGPDLLAALAPPPKERGAALHLVFKVGICMETP